MESTHTFGAVYEELIANKGVVDRVCCAFDFDQTLHLRESIRGDSLSMLERLHALGVPFCIVTAAQPRVGSVKALGEELAELQMDHLFRTTKLAPARALAKIRAAWGNNAELALPVLEKKLVLLLALLTDRKPADLTRIGHSPCKVAEDGRSAVYKLKRGPADWSAELTLDASADAQVDPVACLKEFLARIEVARPAPVYREIDPETDFPEDIVQGDALFLGEDGNPCSADALEKQIEAFLTHDCQYPDWQVAGFMKEPAVEMNVDGIQMARYGNLIAAKYNKAEAVAYFMKEHPGRDRVVFVDDNVDNCFGVFVYFANREIAHPEKSIQVASIWYEPPVEGKGEAFNADQAALAGSIMKNVVLRDHGSALAHCEFGDGLHLALEQATPLSPLNLHFTKGPVSSSFHLVFIHHERDEPLNPSRQPLNEDDRPGCLGLNVTLDSHGECHASTWAFAITGPLAVTRAKLTYASSSQQQIVHVHHKKK